MIIQQSICNKLVFRVFLGIGDDSNHKYDNILIMVSCISKKCLLASKLHFSLLFLNIEFMCLLSLLDAYPFYGSSGPLTSNIHRTVIAIILDVAQNGRFCNIAQVTQEKDALCCQPPLFDIFCYRYNYNVELLPTNYSIHKLELFTDIVTYLYC